MSTPDMLLQGLVIALCLWACWSKWGVPLWAKYVRARHFVAPRLLSQLFLQRMALEIQTQPVPTPRSVVPMPTPTPASHTVLPEEEATGPAQFDFYDDVGNGEGEEEDVAEEEGDEDDDEAESVSSAPIAAPLPVLRPVYLKPVEPNPEQVLQRGIDLWNIWMEKGMAQALHLIVIGQTGAGKTTVLQVFVEMLVAQGLPVVVCDPDAAAGDWPNTQVFGAGDDFKGITRAFKAVQVMAQGRRQARAQGQREFDPFWFVLDEYADIKDECGLAGTLVENALRRWRKLNMHIVIGVQDTQVRTMGFERRSTLLNHARIVTLRLSAEGRRYARIDEEPAIGIPRLEPQRGPATEETVLAPEPEEAFNPVGPLDVGELTHDDAEDWVDPDDLLSSIEDKDDQIRVMLSAGRSYAEIAARLHVATTRISKVKKDFMLEPETAS